MCQRGRERKSSNARTHRNRCQHNSERGENEFGVFPLGDATFRTAPPMFGIISKMREREREKVKDGDNEN